MPTRSDIAAACVAAAAAGLLYDRVMARLDRRYRLVGPRDEHRAEVIALATVVAAGVIGRPRGLLLAGIELCAYAAWTCAWRIRRKGGYRIWKRLRTYIDEMIQHATQDT